VIDSRQTEDGLVIRRRRECNNCGRRFTTYEKIDTIPLMVIKKDKSHQVFDSARLRAGIMKVCEKRPISPQAINQLVQEVEARVYNAYDLTVPSQAIGEMVMEELKKLDEVAYLRFVSVNRQFRDIQTFHDEINKLLTESKAASRKV
jgi:transcriptional repressor NrdR